MIPIPFRVGDLVGITGFDSEPAVIVKAEINADVMQPEYFTTAGSWHLHNELTFVTVADAETMAILAKYVKDEDDAYDDL